MIIVLTFLIFRVSILVCTPAFLLDILGLMPLIFLLLVFQGQPLEPRFFLKLFFWFLFLVSRKNQFFQTWTLKRLFFGFLVLWDSLVKQSPQTTAYKQRRLLISRPL